MTPVPSIRLESAALLFDIPGCAYREDAFIAPHQKHPFEQPPALIVQKVFIPFVLHQFRYDHDNAAIGIFLRKIENKFNNGNDYKAVGGRQEMKLRWFLAFRAERFLHIVLQSSCSNSECSVGSTC